MDGRRGLVPSNFIEKVPDEELEEFHNSLGLHLQDDNSSLSGSATNHRDLDFNSSDESEKLAELQGNLWDVTKNVWIANKNLLIFTKTFIFKEIHVF